MSTTTERFWPLISDPKASQAQEGSTRGYVKILCLKDTEELLGATVVAERAGEMLAELTLAIQHGVKLSQLARTVHPYPTLGEAVQQCALNFNRSRWAKMVAWRNS